MIFSGEVEDKHIQTFLVLADGIVHEATPDVLAPYADPSFDRAKLEAYTKSFTKPSDIPAFKEYIKEVIKGNNSETEYNFALIMSILDSRILAPSLTGSMKLVKEMDFEERKALLISWRDSYLLSFQRLFRLFYALTITTFVQMANDLHNEIIGYPERELNEQFIELSKENEYTYKMLDHPKLDGQILEYGDIDVIIIGSGSGAGVVAETLASKGFKSLILEKGLYFNLGELNFNDFEGLGNLYQNGCTVTTRNQLMTILAGSTFGGGSTVNWSASLKTPFKVRKEWYDKFGLEWAAGQIYDDCMDYVCKKMGVTTEGINHSFANEVLLNGCEKLGYEARTIPQNTGNSRSHNCGFCYLGCKAGIKQGSSACWFKEPAEQGSLFMDKVRVVRILHHHLKAYAIECQSLRTNAKFMIKGPKKIVVAGGSLNTPLVLKKSGFKNKHIGVNLKLHPVTVLMGDFGRGKKLEPYNKSIMTAVCNEVADLDGKAHGARIETILNAPFIESVFLPWMSSDTTRQDLLRYNNMTSMLLIARDTSSGKVLEDPKRPENMIIDYEVNKFDRNALLQALLKTADLLYIEGAETIIHPLSRIPRFTSSKPKEERQITDRDYVLWRDYVSKHPLTEFGVHYGSAHQMCSSRMSGKGPSYGVCDAQGRLFECKNVYVADASAMPTASGVNPMITTMSIARYVALGIAKDLEPKAAL